MAYPGVTVKRIGIESKDFVQKILDDCPTYMVNTEGVHQRPDGAMYELTLLPPDCPSDRKYNLLAFFEGHPIGFIDILKDYPSPGVANLGLLAIRESFQKKNLGRQTFQVLERYICNELKGTKIRLAVNNTNPVQGFWEKMGFTATGEKKPYKGYARDSIITVMEKILS